MRGDRRERRKERGEKDRDRKLHYQKRGKRRKEIEGKIVARETNAWKGQRLKLEIPQILWSSNEELAGGGGEGAAQTFPTGKAGRKA